VFNVLAFFALCLCTGGMHNKCLYYIFNIYLDLVAVFQTSFFSIVSVDDVTRIKS
jgi:hypothetical protein